MVGLGRGSGARPAIAGTDLADFSIGGSRIGRIGCFVRSRFRAAGGAAVRPDIGRGGAGAGRRVPGPSWFIGNQRSATAPPRKVRPARCRGRIFRSGCGDRRCGFGLRFDDQGCGRGFGLRDHPASGAGAGRLSPAASTIGAGILTRGAST
jgi:hypothetical protein